MLFIVSLWIIGGGMNVMCSMFDVDDELSYKIERFTKRGAVILMPLFLLSVFLMFICFIIEGV